jgi:cellulose synthase/poly-beta-1,6-N-acetylglucosamine synthase-like glycosyltransferase
MAFLETVLYVLFRVLAVIFGTIWTITNYYNLYPIIQRIIEPADESPLDRYGTDPVDVLDEEDLPTIDVLVPAYHEHNVIQNAIESIRTADYPQELITITVLVEPDDTETRRAVEELGDQDDFLQFDLPGGYVTDVLVPDEYPGASNKPRALNYGFNHTYSDVVGIIDAEDIVHESLFREIAASLIVKEKDYIQAKLDMANEDDGWLNLLFRAEYGYWHGIQLPAYHNADFPVPLGGTSCFFKRSVLEKASEHRKRRFRNAWNNDNTAWLHGEDTSGLIPWDPVNVTEDFELGFVLWEMDFDFEHIDAPTTEESPLTIGAWIKQRTRWQKGKIYTFFEFVRHPPETDSEKMHMFWQSVTPHIGPINLTGVVVFMFASIIGFEPDPLMVGILSLAAFFTVAALTLTTIGYWLTSDKPFYIKIVRSGIVFSTQLFYWVLQYIADIRAIYQISQDDLGWEKTEHHARHIEAE